MLARTNQQKGENKSKRIGEEDKQRYGANDDPPNMQCQPCAPKIRALCKVFDLGLRDIIGRGTHIRNMRCDDISVNVARKT